MLLWTPGVEKRLCGPDGAMFGVVAVVAVDAVAAAVTFFTNLLDL